MKSKILHLLLLPLILALALTDCAAQSASDTDDPKYVPGEWIVGKLAKFDTCPGTTRPIRGYSVVHVKYGDSLLKVTKKTQVGKKNDQGVGAIEFKLQPDQGEEKLSKETAVVTIIGKSPPPDHPNASVSWLHALGRGTSSLVVCPEDGTPEGVYKYEVSVEGVGTLDPRAEVIQ